ncbi:MAG: V-type ATP synthase subunit I, partial [Spirochaetia bacterium]
LVYMKRDRDQAERILEQNNWKDSPLPSGKQKSSGQPREGIRKQREELKKKQAELRNAAKDEALNRKEDLLAHWSNLKMHELCGSIHGYYGTTGRTAVFSGWVPADQEREISDGIREVTQGRCYLEWHDPDNAEGKVPEEAPVKFTNPKFLRPFEMLVKNYSVPAYGTFDPTPAVAAAFLIMFGLMFGDAGHGLVLMIAGTAGSLGFRKKSARDLSRLVVYCGAAAVAAGVLFGSYFGIALFPPLWFDYHGAVMAGHTSGGVITDIYGVLMITVYFGITVIAAGILINIYNRIRKGDWFGLLMDKAGILGGWIYGAGVYTAFYFAGHDFKSLPDLNLLFLILGLPALLFLLKPAVEFILERRHGRAKQFTPITLLNFLMEWIVEMLEIFSGYLANTLSFLRVAGLGIAHVSLMAAFFEIAGVRDGGNITLGGIIILILGNILVITLEGLSAGIQSLRLNYYEFFTKYFSGNGIAYTPISLKGAA